MKYDELDDINKQRALQYFSNKLISLIIDGLRFNDSLNGDDLQARIDRAVEKAGEMKTPWFLHEYIYDDPVCKGAIEGMAQCDAEDTEYTLSGDRAVIVKTVYETL